MNPELPQEIWINIFNTKGVAALSGNVCKDWENLRTDPNMNLKVKLRSENFLDYLNASYKKPHVKFNFAPTPKQLAEFIKVSPNIKSVDLSHMYVIDVSALRNAHTVNLNCTPVRDVSALCNVDTLDLNDTPVSDVSPLGNVRNLNLSYTYVYDLSHLINVHTLNIKGSRVKDFSNLNHIVVLIKD